MREALRRAVDVRRHRGDAVQCPVCGSHFDAFATWRGREGARCWRCDALERHRALWLFLTSIHPDLLAGSSSLLHFAPEPFLAARLGSRPGLDYVTADLEPGTADRALDLMALALADGDFDAIVCAHVLEHVPDDAVAIRELYRVLAPGGWCVVMVPLVLERETTYEDPAITEPAARAAAFGQEDHVRVYGRDAAERLRAPGWSVEEWEPLPKWLRRYGLLSADRVFCCRKD